MIPRKASRRPLLSHRDPPGTHPTPENDPEGGQEGPLGSSTRTPETFIRMGAIRVGWVGERAGEAPGVPPYVRQLLSQPLTGQCPPPPSHTNQTHFALRHPPIFLATLVALHLTPVSERVGGS